MQTTPTLARILWCLCIALALWPRTAPAQTLTEARVIELVHARDPDIEVAQQAVSLSQSREVAANLYPNPQVNWQREHFPGSGAGRGSEDTLSLRVPLDFSGRRPARNELARANTADGQARASLARSEAVVRALSSYYAVLANDRRLQVTARTVERLEEAARVLDRRHQEGTVSGYEKNRVELETEFARSELRVLEARHKVLRQELSILLGLDAKALVFEEPLTLGARAQPNTHGELPSAARDNTAPPDERRSLSFLKAAGEHAATASDHADSAAWPTLWLMGGVRLGVADQTRYGYVAGVNFALPLFSHGQDLKAQATALQKFESARVRSLEQATRIELARAAAEFELAREELARFEAATGERVALLERAATSGYREGERSVVEQLDAERARAAVELRRLELTITAKQAEVRWRAARGEFE